MYIENVEPLTEGTYSCETNTDEPFFMSMQAQQDLRVYGEYWRVGDDQVVASLDGLGSSFLKSRDPERTSHSFCFQEV